MPASSPSPTAHPSLIAHAFFLVGQDTGGHWLAVETHGRGGGLFASRDAALGYVRHEVASDGAAFRIADAPIDLMFPARRSK